MELQIPPAYVSRAPKVFTGGAVAKVSVFICLYLFFKLLHITRPYIISARLNEEKMKFLLFSSFPSCTRNDEKRRETKRNGLETRRETAEAAPRKISAEEYITFRIVVREEKSLVWFLAVQMELKRKTFFSSSFDVSTLMWGMGKSHDDLNLLPNLAVII